jgi:hypothetical protein
MPTYTVNFHAVVSDSIEIEIDDEYEIDEDTIMQKWECLPLFNGYTTSWDGINIDSIEGDED